MAENINNYCEICDLSFSDKYIFKRHIERINHKNKVSDFLIMSENKKMKLDLKDGLISRIQNLIADEDLTENLILKFLAKEDLLDSTNVNETVIYCETQLAEIKDFLLPKKQAVNNFYTCNIFILVYFIYFLLKYKMVYFFILDIKILYIVANETEKDFFRSLSKKKTAVGKSLSSEGVSINAVPASYNFTSENLQEMKNEYETRVKAIDYEIIRRIKEPKMEALKFVITHFKEEEADLTNPQTQDYE